MKINLGKLKAANLFASDDPTRYYINGVLFEIIDGVAKLVATDGHRMIIIPFALESVGANERFIIPRQLIDKLKAADKKIDCELTREKNHITIKVNGDTFQADMIDGTFPDYSRVIPAPPKKVIGATMIRFNPDLLADMGKVNKLLCLSCSGVCMDLITADHAVVVTPNAKSDEVKAAYSAYIMPMREPQK